MENMAHSLYLAIKIKSSLSNAHVGIQQAPNKQNHLPLLLFLEKEDVALGKQEKIQEVPLSPGSNECRACFRIAW